MHVMRFLSSLPALLGLTGFVVYFFLLRNRGGDRITLDIVAKLRREAPERLPPQATKLDSATLARLIESDTILRSKVGEQDFQLLRDALHQQFITSIIVYGLCGLIFLAGIGLYVYVSMQPTPVSISSVSAESTDPDAQGIPVDLDSLRVKWTASGDPEDIAVSLQDMESQRQTSTKIVRSTEGQVVFTARDYRDILVNREHGGENRLRAVFQTAKSPYFSPGFSMKVGLTVIAWHVEQRIKIIGVIDNTAIPYYDFEAKLIIWAKAPRQQPTLITFGPTVKYGHNDFPLNPDLKYEWNDVKLVYFGPDDRRIVRTQFIGFPGHLL
jgi:hypothetical protein